MYSICVSSKGGLLKCAVCVISNLTKVHKCRGWGWGVGGWGGRVLLMCAVFVSVLI